MKQLIFNPFVELLETTEGLCGARSLHRLLLDNVPILSFFLSFLSLSLSLSVTLVSMVTYVHHDYQVLPPHGGSASPPPMPSPSLDSCQVALQVLRANQRAQRDLMRLLGPCLEETLERYFDPD